MAGGDEDHRQGHLSDDGPVPRWRDHGQWTLCGDSAAGPAVRAVQDGRARVPRRRW